MYRPSNLFIVAALASACAGATSAPSGPALEGSVGPSDLATTCEWRHLPNLFVFQCRSTVWVGERHARANAAEVAEHIRHHPELRRVEVGGHRILLLEADLPSLSMERAEVLRDALVEAGLPRAMIGLRDYGDSQPLGHGDRDPCPLESEGGPGLSRRAEVNVLECHDDVLESQGE